MAATVAGASCYVARASPTVPGTDPAALMHASRFLLCGVETWRGSGSVGRAGQAACRRGSRARLGVVLAVAPPVTITASRVAQRADMVRVFGPGAAALSGLGRLLALDEFFVSPSNVGLPVGVDGLVLESLVYYLEEDQGADTVSQEDDFPQSRHGVQLHFLSSFTFPKSSDSPGESASASCGQTVVPSLFHVRRPTTVPEVLVEVGNDGGAVVKVVSGEFGTSKAPAPLHDFLLLDIVMRPSSVARFPSKPNSGILIYVLEGVGLFNCSSETVSYQNEGHGLWLSASYLAATEDGVVQAAVFFAVRLPETLLLLQGPRRSSVSGNKISPRKG